MSFRGKIPVISTDIVQFKNRVTRSVKYRIGLLEEFKIRAKNFLGIPNKDLSAKEFGVIQNNFKRIFIHDNMDVEETKSLIERLKDIDKIQDKIEYIKALYNELKKQHGFEHVDLPLTFNPGPITPNGRAIGTTKSLMDGVNIDPSVLRKNVITYVAHELRHVKQNYYAYAYDKETYVNTLIDKYLKKHNKTFTKGEREATLQFYINYIDKRWGTPTRKNIPESQIQYAKKCLESHKTYTNALTDVDNYKASFLEKDANSAGFVMTELFQRVRTRDLPKD